MIKKSFAKINLGLKIINQREDGYHNIKSIFIQINLNDNLHFLPSEKFNIESTGIKVSTNQSNTVFRAVKLLEKKFNINVQHKIIIDKRIPLGGGLGGGSSNAALALVTIAQLYKLNITNKDLFNLANEIGSDVPFFLYGGAKMVEGTGNIIRNINSSALINKKILLVFPKFNISTKWAYSQVKKHLHHNDNNNKFSPLTKNVKWKLFNNDFEKIVCTTYPEILKIKDILYKQGALYSGLSGSGSTMFGLYNDNISLNKVQALLSAYHTNIAFPIIQ
ncbi:MAG: 4-(cytidine 5'-diphospho)-2-C-methyl-D-erythritol kinase [Candidatus Marinimicrobia bacterium]|nr:4-(cytidine 5'-diphospho)-2-C-methyl-D-erythritol kinase [Candidatus Neomarinimicrobiota bacterium]|tara:strand:- start:46 stop:876 length:831 start_codon:yes stop_codon:yes gene_type:complete